MYVKIHKSQDSIVTAICDEDLIGKKFSDEEKQLEITERFYKGEITSEEETIKIMQAATNLNLVGKKTIDLALKNKIIDKDSIIKIKNIPHAQIFEI
jgi:uncharacterized protein